MILALAGLSKSGKSTLAKELVSALGWPMLGFGKYVQHVASSKGIALEFSALQTLGQSMVEDDPVGFVHAVFKFGGLAALNDVILDGLRHLEVLTALENYVSPEPVIVVLVRVEHEVLSSRLELAGQDLSTVLNGPAEQQVQTVLAARASLTVDGSRPFNNAVRDIVRLVGR